LTLARRTSSLSCLRAAAATAASALDFVLERCRSRSYREDLLNVVVVYAIYSAAFSRKVVNQRLYKIRQVLTTPARLTKYLKLAKKRVPSSAVQLAGPKTLLALAIVLPWTIEVVFAFRPIGNRILRDFIRRVRHLT
jgi:hypothetical protein